MKSNKTQLNNRGQLDEKLLLQLDDLSKEELIAGFHNTPKYRTACVYLLSEKYNQDDDYTILLLKLLQNEKALYTKIEIQNQLSKHGNIKEMCQYLGKIGCNQYREIPTRPSLKKSYPLPRDIIARSLSYIEADQFNEFYQVLPTLEPLQFQEAIDAFGFFCFYHPEVITIDMFKYVCSCFRTYQNNELTIWKLVTCLSAFPMSLHYLNSLKTIQKHPTILLEVERSIKIINQLNNH